jgi:hypothetical protein
VQSKSSSVWHTGLSGGAPDSVRCARLDTGEQAALGKIWQRTAIIHRTVRWCIGLFGEPTVASVTVGRTIRGQRVAHTNGRQGAPDCPVCTRQCPVRQLAQSCNGRLRQKKEGDRHRTVYSDCPVAHRTVRCATRHKARMAFLVGLQRLLAALRL